MILDTSALAAIFFGEPEANLYTQLIHDSDRCLISAGNFLELAMVMEGQIGQMPAVNATRFSTGPALSLNPSQSSRRNWHAKPFFDFGKGRHPAGLNFGDCFAYSLAKTTVEPLLFKGNDFNKTDVVSAL